MRLVQACERRDPNQRALQLADVALDVRGDVLQHVAGDGQSLGRGLLRQDRDPGLQIRRGDVGDQTPLEPAAQPVLQRGQLLGGPVGGDDDLLLGVVQDVEGVEELLLRPFLVLQELDVIDEQHVGVAVATLERLLAVIPDGVDEVVRELLRAHVLHS